MLEFETNCIWRETFFTCMKPTFLHKTEEFKDLWRHFFWSINPLVPAQCTEQTGQTRLPWLRWQSRVYSQVSPKLGWDEDDINYCLLPALWARQTGVITGAQTVITKVSSGHTSCTCTHTDIWVLCRVSHLLNHSEPGTGILQAKQLEGREIQGRLAFLCRQ